MKKPLRKAGKQETEKFLDDDWEFSQNLRMSLFKLQHVAVRGAATEMRDVVGWLINRLEDLSDRGLKIGRVAAANHQNAKSRIIVLRRAFAKETRSLRKRITTCGKIITAQRRVIRKLRRRCAKLEDELDFYSGPPDDLIGKRQDLSDVLFIADQKQRDNGK